MKFFQFKPFLKKEPPQAHNYTYLSHIDKIVSKFMSFLFQYVKSRSYILPKLE